MSQTFKMLLLCCLVGATAACTRFSNRGTVDKPFINYANTPSLSIEKVELSDSATTLYAVMHFRPGWWFRIADSSRIVADGSQYILKSLDGILANEKVRMPDSGVMHFAMNFPAIPADVTQIDFDEYVSDGYKLSGIDLTGKADFTGFYKSLPKDVVKPFKDGEMPEPKFVYDSTTVNIHIVGYKPEMGDFRWFATSLRGRDKSDIPETPDSLGNAQLKFALAAPTKFAIYGNQKTTLAGHATLKPGETVDMYIDAGLSGLRNMSERDGENGAYPDGYIPSFHNGYYSNLDKIALAVDKEFGMNIYEGGFADYHFTGDEYTDYIITRYKASLDSIESSSMPRLAKELQKVNLQAELIVAISKYRRLLRSNYYNKYNNWGKPIPADSIRTELSDENVRRVAELIDFSNPNLLLAECIDDIGSTEIWDKANVDVGVIDIVKPYNDAYASASKGELTEDQLESLRSKNAEFAKDVELHDKYIKDKLSTLDFSGVTPTPDVAADKLIAEIVKPYKGKVVMVDLWNTWCGPCRNAIALNEPEKQGDLKSDDIEWIYIADESSPALLYFELIKGIKGRHYRVTDDQIQAIRKQFNVDGIPYYILVDKKGHVSGRPDLRDHDKFKRVIKEELAK